MATNTTASFTNHTGNGTAGPFNISFSYLSEAEVDVTVGGVLKTITTHYTFTSATQITFTSGNEPANGATIKFQRDTNISAKKVDFADGSVLTEADLDANSDQVLFAQQEIIETFVKRDGTQTVTGNLIFEGSSDDANETTLAITNPTADRTITVPDRSGTIITSGDTGTVTSTIIADGTIVNGDIADTTITGGKLANDTVTATQIAANAVTASELADNSVDTNALQNGSVTQDKIATDAVTNAKIADNAITTTKLLNGNVTETKLANNAVTNAKIAAGAVQNDSLGADAVTGSKIADDTINSEHYVAGSIDLEHLATNSVNSDKIVNGSITGTDIANDQIDSQHYAADSIDTEHYAPNSIDNAALGADIILSGNIADSQIGKEHLKDNSVGTGEIINGNVTSDKLSTNSVQTAKIVDNAVTADKIADEVIVTNSEQASASVNDTTFFTTSASDARYFNISSGDTIKDGQTFPDNDTSIATTAAINDRIIDLVDDVGGFVPIANETSFPTANPDVNNGTGTVVSVATASTNLTPSGTTVTIANGAGTGNTVTITGVPSVISSGFGFLVETTTTLHTYTFHRLVPKATEVTTVAGISSNITTVAGISSNVTAVAGNATNINAVAGNNSNITAVADNSSNINSAVSNASNINSAVSNATNINTVAGSITNVNNVGGSIANVNTVAGNLASVNSFANTYRIGSSNPTTSLDVGDLFFNTTANELKVYNGSAWQGGVTATGNFAVVTGNTFTGNNTYNDNVKVRFGTGNDAELFWDGSATRFSAGALLNLRADTHTLTNAANSETMLLCTANSGVELNFDAAKKFETTSYGAKCIGRLAATTSFTGGDSVEIKLGDSDDLRIYHNAGADSILNATGLLNVNGTTGVHLQYNGTARVQTTSSGTSIQGASTLNGAVSFLSSNAQTAYHFNAGNGSAALFKASDNAKFAAGSDSDLQIYFDGTHSKIVAPDGEIHIQADNFMLISDDSSGRAIYLDNANSRLELGFDGGHDAYFTGSGVEFIQDVKFDGATAGRDIVFDRSDNALEFADNAKASFGNSSNLQIYYDGYNPIINAGTETLRIVADNIHLEAGDFGDEFLRCNHDGSVDLYYDNSLKISTQSYGASVTGTLTASGNIKLATDNFAFYAGAGDDLRIQHTGTFAKIQNTANGGDLNLYADTNVGIYNAAGTETKALFATNGAVSLYFDNTLKLKTHSSGVFVSTDANIGRLILGDTSGNYGYQLTGYDAASSATGGRFTLVDADGGTVIDSRVAGGNLFCYNNVKLGSGSVDNLKAVFGAGDDLEIFHDGSHSRIKDNTTAVLSIQSDGGTVIHDTSANEFMAKFLQNGKAIFYHDNAIKLQTESYGASVTGNLVATGSLITESGSLGVGTTSPSTSVEIFAANNGITNVLSANNRLRFRDNDSTTTNGQPMGTIEWYTNDSNNAGVAAFISVKAGSDQGNGELVFGTGTGNAATERMRINKDGDVFVGFASRSSTVDGSSSTLAAYGNSSTTTGNVAGSFFGGAVTSQRFVLSFSNNNGIVGSVSTNGTSTQFNTSSDYRLKENVVSISDAITRLKKLKPSRFNYKTDATKTLDGFLAHEVSEAVPEAVAGEKDGMAGETYYEEGDTLPTGKEYGDVKTYSTTKIHAQGLDLSKLVPLLTAALQDSISKIEVLETKVAALEAA